MEVKETVQSVCLQFSIDDKVNQGLVQGRDVLQRDNLSLGEQFWFEILHNLSVLVNFNKVLHSIERGTEASGPIVAVLNKDDL